jgi:hypothetical protein
MATGLPGPPDPSAARKGADDPLNLAITPALESALAETETISLLPTASPSIPTNGTNDRNGDGRSDRNRGNGNGNGNSNRNKDNGKNNNGLDPTAERALIAAGSIGKSNNEARFVELSLTQPQAHLFLSVSLPGLCGGPSKRDPGGIRGAFQPRREEASRVLDLDSRGTRESCCRRFPGFATDFHNSGKSSTTRNHCRRAMRRPKVGS